MKKEISQNEGVNQVALIKSNDNQINIINSPIEYMSWLIKNGKLEEAVEVFTKVYNEAEKLHPLYPLYRYKPVEIGSKIVFEHHPANEKVAQTHPLQYKGKFSISDRDFNEGETIGDYLTRKYFSQEKISIDMKYIETYIGDQFIEDKLSIEQNALNDGKWFILPRELPPPIKAKLVLIEQTDRVIIDYLELRITEVNKNPNRIVISNINQEGSPIVLSLSIPNIFIKNSPVGSDSKFNIRIRESFEGKVSAEKIFLEIMKYAGQSSKMSLIDLESQKPFFTAGINMDYSQEFQDMDYRISLLSDLLQIENTLDVQFQLPEMVVEEDFENIEILKAIIEGKTIESKIENVSVILDNIKALEKIVYNVDSRPIIIQENEVKQFELFGVEFENIKVTHTIENLVVKEPERIKKKLKFFDDGETVKVEFKPGTKNTVTTQYSLES
ncbi:hypothetical protein AB1K91_18805 [Terribacillus sp. 179-K 1B1 HS]|uniref:hypothetical protein n=1 Tax=Terribacillus sp. 179-K 1B1 HS TaxID=3142388 RepID=UPI0039A0B5BA